jgi:WD40 repeat protein
VATGEVRETIVSPPAFPETVCFSPDGQTLATSGNGCVLLWDLTDPPARH